ncbi:hypothetical protein EG329_002331 [Mollisiaceae sp. DMI_Dod_QoI]|nr:hypothetical protein EG329_002331 [Helotiales sp. DMI_Dod_QoI]
MRLPGTWAAEVEKRGEKRPKHKKSSKDRPNSWLRFPAGQKVVQGEGSDDKQRSQQSVVAGQQAVGCAPTPLPTKLSTAVVHPPKITNGPSLVRRKTVTFTLTEAFTTTDANSNTITFTSTITSTTTSGAPDPTQTAAANGVIPQVPASATRVPKTAATSTNTGSGGLSTAALGGIIGGAIFFLSAILIAAIFIIRGLNRATKAQELANSRRSGSSGPRSGRSEQNRPSLSPDMDNVSIDPLIMSGSQASGSFRRPSGVSNPSPHTILPEMEGSNSPPVFLSPFSPRSPPHTHYPKGYNSVPGSESQYSQSSGGYRNPSLESSPPLSQNPASYFDIPTQGNNRVSYISSQGRRPSHGRNYSNSSDQSQVSQSSSVVELEAGKDGSRKSSLQTDGEGDRKSGLQRFMSRMIRRKSDPVVLTGGPTRGGKDWPPSPREGGTNGGGLWHIAEAGESKLAVDLQQNQDPRTPMTPFQDISLMDQPPGFRNN